MPPKLDANGNPIIEPVVPPPAPAPADTEALILGNFEDADPKELRRAFKSVQLESKEHRQKAANYKLERDAALARAAELEAAQTARETAKLEEEKRFKELYEQEKAQKESVALNAQKAAIDAKIENHFLAKGIDPKFIKLLDRTGINIDSTGSVKGIGEAYERMETEWGEIIKPAAKPKADDDDDEPPAGKPGKRRPGSNQTYNEVADAKKAKFGGAKAPATGSGTPASAKPDFSKMTKQEQTAWYAQYKVGLGKK